MTQAFDQNISPNAESFSVSMAYLQSLLDQRAQKRTQQGNIAIIGCGYIGTALADSWKETEHFVTGTTTSSGRIVELKEFVNRVSVIRGEDANAVQALVQDQNTIVVSVAPTRIQSGSFDPYAATYLETAKNLADALHQSPGVRQVIYLSSCSVYGDRKGRWVDETSVASPMDARGQVLHEAEQVLMQASSEMQNICIFRLGGIYGPGRELVRMFGGLAGAVIPGRGSRVINWIHRDDIVAAIEFARVKQLQGIYNLVDDSKLTVRQQVDAISSKYGLPAAIWDSSRLGSRRASLCVSNQKIKAEGFSFTYPQLLV